MIENYELNFTFSDTDCLKEDALKFLIVPLGRAGVIIFIGQIGQLHGVPRQLELLKVLLHEGIKVASNSRTLNVNLWALKKSLGKQANILCPSDFDA